jgi:type I restriction enzyme M protein
LDRNYYESLRQTDTRALEQSLYGYARLSPKGSKFRLFSTAICFLALQLKQSPYNELNKKLGKFFPVATVSDYLTELLKLEKEAIESLNKRFDKETLESSIIFSAPKFLQEASHSTPDGIIRLAMKLLDIKRDDRVLDLGSGTGGFLIETFLSSSAKDLKGVEIDVDNLIISSIKSFVVGAGIEFIQGNIISQEYKKLGANKVFSHFPFGKDSRYAATYIQHHSELSSFFGKPKLSLTADWIYVLAAHFSQAENGRTVCLMANNGTWNLSDEQVRKELVEQGIIEGVIALAPGLLPTTGIGFSMIILGQNNKSIQLVDATEIYTSQLRQNILTDEDVKRIIDLYHSDAEVSQSVSEEELAKNGYALYPSRYIDIGVKFENAFQLGEIVTSISRGSSISRRELDQLISRERTGFYYLKLQDISDGIIEEELTNLKTPDEKLEKYFIVPGSLLISRTAPFRIAKAEFKGKKKIVANGNLYFVTIDEKKINPGFVEAFLQSEHGIAQLTRLSKGGVIESISIQDLKRVQIPKLDRKIQERIASEYADMKILQASLKVQMEIVENEKRKLFEEVL